jgi:transcriptional regulator with XRE-family HTH domain
MTKRFNSVEDLVDNLYEDKAEAKATKEFIQSKELARICTLLRVNSGLSQDEVAARLKWSQSKVSKFEHADNKAISVSDLEDYTEALNMRLEITFTPVKMKIVERVKMCFFQMQTYLNRLSGMGKKDAKIQAGVDGFMKEASYNLMLQALECLDKGAKAKKDKSLTIHAPTLVDQTEAETAVPA